MDQNDQRVRTCLRAATAEDHARVDAAFGGFDLGCRDHYARFLRAQAKACWPIEAALERADVSRLLPDWPDRRRADLLRQDLRELGAGDPDTEAFGALATPAATMGAVYVLEGSKLGGQLLARSVPERFPRRFICAGGSYLWRSFMATLERELTTPVEVEEAVTAAQRVFAIFETSARREIL